MKGRRVAIFIEGLGIGGQQLHVLEVARQAKPLVDKLFFLYGEGGDLRSEFELVGDGLFQVGVSVRNLKHLLLVRPVVLIRLVLKLSSLIRREEIDTVVVNGFYTFFLSLFGRLFHRYRIVRLVGGDLSRNESFYWNSRVAAFCRLHGLVERYVTWKANVEILTRNGIPSSRIHIENGAPVDTALMAPSRSWQNTVPPVVRKVREEGGLVVGWVGRLAPDKEVTNTLNVLEELVLRGFGSSLAFVVVGDGSDREAVLSRARRILNPERVVYLGLLSRTQTAEAYSLIDLEVLIDHDPMGGSHLREAMSCGRTVLTTSGPSQFQSSWIRDGETGFVVEVAGLSKREIVAAVSDRIEALIPADRRLMNDVGLRAREWIVANFDQTVVARRTALALLGEPPPAL